MITRLTVERRQFCIESSLAGDLSRALVEKLGKSNGRGLIPDEQDTERKRGRDGEGKCVKVKPVRCPPNLMTNSFARQGFFPRI